MSRYITGENRHQTVLLPPSLDEYVDEENPVRAVDVFVDELDLAELGFERTSAAATGRPGYHPSTMLKIYIYGYLNRIQSSRRLERESRRNLELMWLTERLSPDFKTIADFRKDNGQAIQKVCSQFVLLCRQIGMFSESSVVIDGSKFKAVNSRDQNFTAGKLKARIEQAEKRVARYLDDLDRADRQQESLPAAHVENLKQRIKSAREHLKRLAVIEQKIKATPDGQISLTDPDSRSMATSGKGTGVVGYNVQTAVDTKHHLIVAHRVTNLGHDRTQLAAMGSLAKQMTGQTQPTVYADRGYYSGNEIISCEKQNIQAMVPKPITSGARKAGRFDKRDFQYDATTDEYICPAGARAIKRMDRVEKGMEIQVYWSSACPRCPLKTKCTTSDYRRVRRWVHEDVLDRMEKRLIDNPLASRIRRGTVEHPFGTFKSWMGSTHFQMKTIPKVSTEMSLHALAYNLKRMLAILGTGGLIQAIQT